MPPPDAAPVDRSAFAERMRVQLAARYPGAAVTVDPARFALQVRGAGIDTVLPLGPLHLACIRQPADSAGLITRFVSSLERQMTPRTGADLSLARLLWCVRSQAYLSGVGRAGELLTRDVAADLIAFVCEDLPGAVMRGVPRDEWRATGATDDDAAAAATDNTNARFSGLVRRIDAADRIPADGWRMAADGMYQSSALLVADVLQALVCRSDGDVLLAAPDRGVLLAIPAKQPNAERFQRRVVREWRESLNPCSREVLVTDGVCLVPAPTRRSRAAAVLPWLSE